MGSSSCSIKSERVLSGPSVVLIGGNCSNFLIVGMIWVLVMRSRKIWSALRYKFLLMFGI